MDIPSLSGVTSLHLIGVGGSGMRQLARLFLARGLAVSGSDAKQSSHLTKLAELGVDVTVGHDAGNVEGADVVVASSAIPADNPEIVRARQLGIPVWARAQGLAALAAGTKSVAVAGTHGKTTTTSMLAHVLVEAGVDPSYLIGGDLNETGSGARAGGSDVFVFEADESDGSFLLCDPLIGIVTNIEVDHLDFYVRGRADIEPAFSRFLSACERAVVCGDDPGVIRAIETSGVDVVRYGMDSSNDVVVSMTAPGPGGANGYLSVNGQTMKLDLMVDGAHNLLNAAAVVATSSMLGVEPERAVDALSTFSGVHRRFEFKGSVRGADIFDDYGHVPTELRLTLEVARMRQPRRLIAVFQPHRYVRTQALWRELGESLAGADVIVITDVYGAGQAPIEGVTGEMVVEGLKLAAADADVRYLPDKEKVAGYLADQIAEGDLVITMGCGDIWKAGEQLLALAEDGS